MIKIKDLEYSYAGSRHLVFDGFNLSLSENCIYGLLGKNGMGKSTLLYLISGLLRPKSGVITFDGVDTSKRRPETLQDIFIVPEEYEMPKMSLSECIKINCSFYPHFSEEVLRKCLSDFELPADVDLKSLSMGQKKKVYMSLAMAAGYQTAADGRAHERSGHSLEEPLPQGGGQQYDRRPHPDYLHPSGARCGVAARPHLDTRRLAPADG
jgi:ABC-type multidrug transport system ATPase subunit